MEQFREDHLGQRKQDPIRILDVGSRSVNGSVKDIFNIPPWEYVGLDIFPGSGVDIVVKDKYHWEEIDDESFDVVVSSSTFEHVEYFWLTAKEIGRVLKTEGLFCLNVPSSGPIHNHPRDCWRFNVDGVIALAKWSGMRVLSAGKIMSKDRSSQMWQDVVLIAEKESVHA